MPRPFEDDDVKDIRREIEEKQPMGSESEEELQARIQQEHAEKLKKSVEGHPLSHVPGEAGTDSMGYAPHTASSLTPTPFTPHPGPDIPFSGKAGEILRKCAMTGEPVFVFRAKDIFSVMVLAKYLEIIESYGPDDFDFQRTIGEAITDFKAWQAANTDKVRYPD